MDLMINAKEVSYATMASVMDMMREMIANMTMSVTQEHIVNRRHSSVPNSYLSEILDVNGIRTASIMLFADMEVHPG